ncbi:unnamed protein product [Schistosoma mattheei]|uniref:Uncharacterized protein n=1 Tax=Schistosoma mattheei TaxID=31246 RepID=A0A183NFW7_9TREM|nr:unnamed protein product [Schistosoma mattheei]
MDKKAAVSTRPTRAEKAKAQAEYTEVHKQVKRSIRTDKRKYVEDLAMTEDKAAREGNVRQLYDTSKKLADSHLNDQRKKDAKPRDQEVEFCKERLCTDQTSTLRIIVD